MQGGIDQEEGQYIIMQCTLEQGISYILCTSTVHSQSRLIYNAFCSTQKCLLTIQGCSIIQAPAGNMLLNTPSCTRSYSTTHGARLRSQIIIR